jgi:hypothetical protein
MEAYAIPNQEASTIASILTNEFFRFSPPEKLHSDQGKQFESQLLKTAAADHPFHWEDHIRPLCMAYSSSVNSTTGYSPFFLMFGRRPQMPLDLMYAQESVERDPTPTSEGVCPQSPGKLARCI